MNSKVFSVKESIEIHVLAGYVYHGIVPYNSLRLHTFTSPTGETIRYRIISFLRNAADDLSLEVYKRDR